MRISDWSSDVCSSDLPKLLIACSKQLTCCLGSNVYKIMGFPTLRRRPHKLPAHTVKDHSSTRKLPPQLAVQSISPQRAAHLTPLSSRSEEHTSELQSLMRISYAVFCLKKKQQS